MRFNDLAVCANSAQKKVSVLLIRKKQNQIKIQYQRSSIMNSMLEIRDFYLYSFIFFFFLKVLSNCGKKLHKCDSNINREE